MIKESAGEPLISVIIPVYNVEKYIDRCMESVLNQTYRNLEIILVDDGSTDGSGKKCDVYAQEDARVKVIHQVNQGQGAARNNAIRISKGEYIAFIDSDDVLDTKYIMKLYNLLISTGSKIACCSLRKFKTEIPPAKDNETGQYKLYSSAEAIESLCHQGEMTNSPWCKLICNKVVRERLFPEGTGYEDFAVVYKWFDTAGKISYTPEKLYFYRQLENSTMHTSFSAKKMDRVKISEELLAFIEKNYPEIEDAGKTRFFLSNIQTLMWLPIRAEYKENYKEIGKNIRKYRKTVIKDKKAKKQLKLMAMASYCGMGVYRLLGGLYRRSFS